MSIQEGKIQTTFGTPLVGIKITIDDGLPPAELNYVTERVSEILNVPEVRVTRLSNTHIIVEASSSL